MSMGSLTKQANMYKQVSTQSEVLSASPHRVIQLLMQGVLDKIAIAKGQMERDNTAEIGRNISLAISIIDGLRISLDKEIGGDLAENLDALYDYMVRRLYEGNVNKDPQQLDEVATLMREIKTGWDAIPDEAKNAHESPAQYLANKK